MPEELLTVLKFCLIAVLYLFLFRVVKVVWAQVSRSEPVLVPQASTDVSAGEHARSESPGRSPRDGGPSALVAVDPPSLVGITYPLRGPLTFGRGPDATVMLDDPFLSHLHLEVARDRRGRWTVQDLGSTNGTTVNDERLTRHRVLKVGDRIVLSSIVLEVH
ncbi:MAG: FHA domain-containing protein [Microthrixaceae bacterium]